MKKVALGFSLLLVSLKIFSQDTIISQEDNYLPKQTRVFQLTYIYPLSTNGFLASEIKNNLSINLLIGINGGVEGLEFGGFGNVNFGDVEGIQVAGYFNINKGFLNGIQISGGVNLNNNSSQGLQISSLANANSGSFDGVQITGLINFNGNSENQKPSEICQISSLANISLSKVDGVQISGLLNYAGDSSQGLQISLINISKNFNGTQIGLINISSDTTNTTSIGLINFFKNGLKQISLSYTDLNNIDISLKLGSRAFYTIFKAGIFYNYKNFFYSTGFGVGTSFCLNQKNSMMIEYSTTNLFDFFHYYNIFINKLDFLFNLRINKTFSFSFGPNISLLQKYKITSDNFMILPIYKIVQFSTSRFDNILWLGASINLNINL